MTTEIEKQALSNAVSGQSTANYQAIVEGFINKGIEPDDITPRENIFTYHAWRALGRTVKKGQSGVKVITQVPFKKKVKNDKTGEMEEETHYRMTKTTVFHISQTKELEERAKN